MCFNISKLMPVKFFPAKISCVCSKYFGMNMVEKAGCSKRTAMKPYAVPTIFSECSGQAVVLFIFLEF